MEEVNILPRLDLSFMPRFENHLNSIKVVDANTTDGELEIDLSSCIISKTPAYGSTIRDISIELLSVLIRLNLGLKGLRHIF